MKEDLEGILCDSLVDILDVKIRKSLANLSLLLPVNEGITVSYLLSGQPFLLPHGAIRTYHLGVTSKHHIGGKFYPTTIESDHDVIYHIHEALLSEITDSVCKQGYMDGNFTNEGNQVRMICQKASISVKNMEAAKTANILLTLMLKFHDEEALVTKKYAVTVLYNSRLRILFRLKSEIVDPNDRFAHYSDQIFAILSEVMRSHVSLPLPIPTGAHTDRSMIKLLPDRIIFATDFVYTK
ncbi:hypothetical protein ANCCAN_09273 [Ancylostoma caninum]|uniref:Uncharacterized protein n=1 Tax=Ancylostoma caninum TaxID=29170 RepID=A0A368GM18_ANCCA|nr:hypothetical protein ANCCAN_09273 [Ancylostoma caninum]